MFKPSLCQRIGEYTCVCRETLYWKEWSELYTLHIIIFFLITPLGMCDSIYVINLKIIEIRIYPLSVISTTEIYF